MNRLISPMRLVLSAIGASIFLVSCFSADDLDLQGDATFDLPTTKLTRNSMTTAREIADIDQEIANREIVPAMVFQRIQRVEDELELIRAHLGAPRVSEHLFEVRGIKPRQSYFLAEGLFRKANRLGFEKTQEFVNHADIAPKSFEPKHVFQIVSLALRRLLVVKEKLGIKTRVEDRPIEASRTPSDNFDKIGKINRQLDMLLQGRIQVAEAYQRIQHALRLLHGLHARLPDALQPSLPQKEYGKTPRDVLNELFRAYQSFLSVKGASESEALIVLETKSEEVYPADVYGFASFMVSDLTHLYRVLGLEHAPLEWEVKGAMTPSETFQLARYLMAVAESFSKKTDKNPDWMEGVDRGNSARVEDD